MNARRTRQCAVALWVLLAGVGWSSRVFADEQIRGVIIGRGNDGTVTLQMDDASTVTVLLGDAASVRRTDGVRETRVGAAALRPGLRVKVSGAADGNRFVARKLTFSRADYKTALEIEGGVFPTDQRSLENQRRIQQNAQLIQQQQEMLARQDQQIASNRETIRANDSRMVATTGALAARIGNLAGYEAIKSVTVYFANGKASIRGTHRTEIQQLAAEAQSMPAYVVQVQGYASAVGPLARNQELSKQRADAVTAVLQQNGVPLTNIVVPAAMGVTEQVASNKTAKGQAENRRTIVTLLQNKGIAGKP